MVDVPNIRRLVRDPRVAIAIVLLTAAINVCVVGAWRGLAASPAGLTVEQLSLASCSVESFWRDRTDDTATMLGSAVVVGRKDDKLVLVTNLHVLNLQTLAQNAVRPPVVREFSVKVTFPGGQQRRVEAFGEESGYLDLCLLGVNAAGLIERRDYLTLQSLSLDKVSVGDEAVAVGNPRGLDNSVTFGHVSNLWTMKTNGQSNNQIQIDTPMNPGNSGGPLLVKKGDKHYWIGVNTWQVSESQGLEFAISAEHARSSSFTWHAADKQGAAEYIRKRFRADATAQ